MNGTCHHCGLNLTLDKKGRLPWHSRGVNKCKGSYQPPREASAYRQDGDDDRYRG